MNASVSAQDYEIHFLKDTLNAMRELVRIVDDSGNVLFANDTMLEELDCSSERELMGPLGEEFTEANVSIYQHDAEDGAMQREFIIAGKVYEMYSSPVVAKGGEVWGTLECYRNITRTKSMQQAILMHSHKLEEDLDLALRVQQALLPKRLPNTDPYSFYFGFEPCEKVGGDLVDVFDMGHGRRAFYIADVSGHGVMAAMLTVFLKQATRAYLRNEDYSPSRILEYVYEMFNELNLDEEIYITVFMGVIDLKLGTLTYTNAGHNCAPLLYDFKTVTELSVPGIPICYWFPKPMYKDHVLKLPERCRFLCYTDGLPDCCKPFRDVEEVKAGLIQPKHGDEVVELLLDAVRRTNPNGQRQDDIAILMFERE